ncbi:hypothetical protein TNCV_2480271 [Trichonephila clavipes]|nr:hypothetical protein TNCV_2480271 [Trichonephila clavipes]
MGEMTHAQSIKEERVAADRHALGFIHIQILMIERLAEIMVSNKNTSHYLIGSPSQQPRSCPVELSPVSCIESSMLGCHFQNNAEVEQAE